MPEGEEAPDPEARRGGENLCGGGIGEVTLEGVRGLGGSGVAVRGLPSVCDTVDMGRVERRGGGKLGFGFSSSCCCCSSWADTNEEGEEGASSLLIDEDTRL